MQTIGQYTLEGVSAVEEGITLGNGEFQAALPTIIQLAEERIIRDLNSNIFDQEINGTFTEADPYIGVPTDYLGIRSLRIATDNVTFIPMQRKDITWLENYWRNETVTGIPIYYAMWGTDAANGPSSFKLAPTPYGNVAYILRYVQRPATISPDNDETWLSIHAADCLLYACLAESMGYLREDLQSEAGMTSQFESKYARELEKLRSELSNQIITGFYF